MRKKPPTNQIGDSVLLHNANPPMKTTQKFKGPYKIIDDRYKVEGFDERHRRYSSVHAPPEYLKLVTVQKESADNDSASDTE